MFLFSRWPHELSLAACSCGLPDSLGTYNMLQTKRKTKTQKSGSGGPCGTFIKDKCILGGHPMAREQHSKPLP